MQLDATPENSNDEECATCKAQPTHPCVYSTTPPIARDRMHFARAEAAQRTAHRRKREALADAAAGKWQPGDVVLDQFGIVWQRDLMETTRPYPWRTTGNDPDQSDEDMTQTIQHGGLMLARNGQRVS